MVSRPRKTARWEHDGIQMTLEVHLLGVNIGHADFSVLFAVQADGVAVEPSAGDNVDDLAAGSAGDNVVSPVSKRNPTGITKSEPTAIAKG